VANHFYRLTWRTPLHNMRLKGKYPLKLLAVLPDKVAGDARAGKAIRAGYFLFRGQKLPLADLDFNAPMSAPLAEYLHGFRWLRDLGSTATREQGAPIAEAVMRKWLAANAEKPSEPAWAPENAGWRLIFWAAYAPYILSSTDLVYRSLLLTCFARTARHLDRSGRQGSHRLAEARSLGRRGCGGAVAARRRAAPGLWRGGPEARAGKGALYNDGGIISRSPTDLLRTIELLGLVNAAYDAVNDEPPSFITETLARTVAAFARHHAWRWRPCELAGCGRDQFRAGRARRAGQRRTHPSAAAGAGLGLSAHRRRRHRAAGGCRSAARDAGCRCGLRFYLRARGERRAGPADRQLRRRGSRRRARSRKSWHRVCAAPPRTAPSSSTSAIRPRSCMTAHSASGVTEVELHRQELENGSRIEVSHDGYVRRLGYMHRRLLLVSNDGRDIRGEDMLLPSQRRRKPAAVPYVLRFHLAPHVDASLTADEQGALLRIDMAALWQFRAGAGKLSIEESLWVDGEGRPHATKQLVVSAVAEPGGNSLGWLLKRVESWRQAPAGFGTGYLAGPARGQGSPRACLGSAAGCGGGYSAYRDDSLTPPPSCGRSPSPCRGELTR
jgi:uncharacterized heparinase superfamily protein